MTAVANDVVWVLELSGTLLTPLMARNALKSNVTWTSYPFVPPTGTSGFFADLVNGMKWYEINNNCVRHLHELPDYHGVFALGAYPNHGQLSHRHFRAHIGSLSFNYEAHVWAIGRNEGKKLAVIEEFMTDELRFVVAARKPEPLQRLYQAVRGRVAPIAKKGSVQLEFTAQPKLTCLERHSSSSGTERTLVVMPFLEIGNLPNGLLPYLVSISSKGNGKNVQWYTQYCAWHWELRFRQGVDIYKADSIGISCSLIDVIMRDD